ncbi:MAG: 2-C-methyl-D-erythritol 4-phosphate cytidylyltransferase [Chitinophagaceae bacterium]
MNHLKKIAVVVAGGAGIRMKQSIPKQFLLLRGKPVLYYCLATFQNTFPDLEIILVLPEDHFSEGASIVDLLQEPQKVRMVQGGSSRFQSVKNGLSLVQDPSILFIHDGARPLVSSDLIRKCYDQACQKGSAIPTITLKENIRVLNGEDNHAVQRSNYRLIQTPQTFHSAILLPAFDQEDSPLFTDEATVVENNGQKVYLINGEEKNIKITHPLDLDWAAFLLENFPA